MGVKCRQFAESMYNILLVYEEKKAKRNKQNRYVNKNDQENIDVKMELEAKFEELFGHSVYESYDCDESHEWEEDDEENELDDTYEYYEDSDCDDEWDEED